MYKKTSHILVLVFVVCFLIGLLVTSVYGIPICGNGIKEDAEECDNGVNNSDSKPNSCRSGCTLANCRDWVIDDGEECDDGPQNSDKIPGACRRNCRQAYCGDGVLDLTNDEECDDKNNNSYDGCYKCKKCYKPKDDLVIHQGMEKDIKLCPGTYQLEDKGQKGIIIVQSKNVRLNCEGVIFVGLERKLTQTVQKPDQILKVR